MRFVKYTLGVSGFVLSILLSILGSFIAVNWHVVASTSLHDIFPSQWTRYHVWSSLAITLWYQWDGSALLPGNGVEIPESLVGRLVVVTGGTSGLGLGAALAFCQLGADVIITGRSLQKAEAAAAELSARAGASAGHVTGMSLDLTDFGHVREFASNISKSFREVNVLVLNAGIGGRGGKLTPDGFDVIYATNFLGHYLLTELLLPRLAQGASIVSVSSWWMWAALHEDMFQRAPGPNSYAVSKLAQMCHGLALRRRLKGRASVSVLHPGFCNTSVQHGSHGANPCDPPYEHGVCFSPEEAGKTLLHSAFVVAEPPPDAVYAYWFGQYKTLKEYGTKEMASVRIQYKYGFRHTENYQRLTRGLHGAPGPECDEETQERLLRWSANEIGIVAE